MAVAVDQGGVALEAQDWGPADRLRLGLRPRRSWPLLEV